MFPGHSIGKRKPFGGWWTPGVEEMELGVQEIQVARVAGKSIRDERDAQITGNTQRAQSDI